MVLHEKKLIRKGKIIPFPLEIRSWEIYGWAVKYSVGRFTGKQDFFLCLKGHSDKPE